MQTDFDNDLLSYFTDVEHLRNLFKEYITSPKLLKRLIVIHGVGGVGKSSLLKIFRLQCKNESIPVALTSGDDAKSVFDVITFWTDELKEDGIKFPLLNKTLESYRSVQAKVNDQVKKSQNRMADIASKAASKTAESAGGALLGAAIGSIVPGIGTAIGGVLGGVVSGMGAEALTDWLRGFLTKPDVDLLLDPTKRLSADFIEDMAKAAEKKRVVLLLDTFEQISMLEDWIGDVAKKTHPNVLIVIAGRKLPNWNHAWPGWMMNAQVEELKPMTENIMRQLIHRYYATMRGGEPDAVQVDAIIRFAHGLPMVITSAVQLWVKYGLEDFQSVKAEIVANLVDRLMEGVPNSLIPALEAAAVVRWFDQPILRAVTMQEEVRDVYNELRRFPFVRTRVEGIALHDSVREIMDENLRVQDSERHAKLHEHAAMYFEKQLKKSIGEEAERLELERLYHRVYADEESGIKLFQETAEPFARYKFVGRLRILMNDVNTYSLHKLNSQLWREYYNARLLDISLKFSEAKIIYKAVSDNEQGEPKLRAYALCDLAQMCTNDPEVFLLIGKSQQLVPNLDSKLAYNFSSLRYAYMFKGELDKAVDALKQQYEYYKGIGDKNGVVYSLDMLKDIYGLLGNWKMAASVEKEALEILKTMPSNPFLYTRIVGHNLWYKVWSGHYSEAERGMRQAFALAEKEEQIDSFPGLYRDLGFVLGLQRRWLQAQECFIESAKKYQELDASNTSLGSTYGFWGAILAQQGMFQEAEEYLMNGLLSKKAIQDNNGIPEILVWLGQMYEIMAKSAQDKDRSDLFSKAEAFYNQSLEYRWTSRRYFECSSLSALARIKYSCGKLDESLSLLAQAEKIAIEYQYHDLNASIELVRGHCQWAESPTSQSNSFESAQLCYKRALFHAISYNRFLLDEIVGDNQVYTPLTDIISQCSLHGLAGRKMLEDLANWWETSVFDLPLAALGNGTLAEAGNISLTQVEQLIRQSEPGNGEPQSSVIETVARFLKQN